MVTGLRSAGSNRSLSHGRPARPDPPTAASPRRPPAACRASAAGNRRSAPRGSGLRRKLMRQIGRDRQPDRPDGAEHGHIEGEIGQRHHRRAGDGAARPQLARVIGHAQAGAAMRHRFHAARCGRACDLREFAVQERLAAPPDGVIGRAAASYPSSPTLFPDPCPAATRHSTGRVSHDRITDAHVRNTPQTRRDAGDRINPR